MESPFVLQRHFERFECRKGPLASALIGHYIEWSLVSIDWGKVRGLVVQKRILRVKQLGCGDRSEELIVCGAVELVEVSGPIMQYSIESRSARRGV